MARYRSSAIILVIVLLWILMAFPAESKDNLLSEEAQKCLECHGKKGIIKRFENKESVEAYVDIERFKSSVHKSLRCSDCHTDFSIERHPDRRFRSKEQYRIKSSLVCRQCHGYEQIKKRSIHDVLLTEEKEGKPHLCTNCHGSHAVMRVTGKFLRDEKDYCMGCHGSEMRMEFRNGETMSLKVNLLQIQDSVHSKLNCSDCHFGFSSEQHPKRNFRSRRDYTIASAETCRRCHFDKYVKVMDSVHHLMRSQGNLNAPVCTDCHNSHSTVHFGEKELIAQKCRRCHSGIFETYVKSVHGKALLEAHNQDVPVCTDCHTSHEMTDPSALDYKEKVPEICSRCHANKAIVGKYGLSTDVVKTYLTDFHGVTLQFYKKQQEKSDKPVKQIAVCTDCHGIHDIMSGRSTEPAIIRSNLTKSCQRCHEGASLNFSDAWLSHYEPSIAKAPVVFIVSLVYKILIPVMVIGLLLQILLHIWRYAVNR